MRNKVRTILITGSMSVVLLFAWREISQKLATFREQHTTDSNRIEELEAKVAGGELRIHQLMSQLSIRDDDSRSNSLEIARLRNKVTVMEAADRAIGRSAQVSNSLPSDAKSELPDPEEDEPTQNPHFLSKRAEWLKLEGGEELTYVLSDQAKSDLLGYTMEGMEAKYPGALAEMNFNTDGWSHYEGPYFSYQPSSDRLIVDYMTTEDQPWQMRRSFMVVLGTGEVNFGGSFPSTSAFRKNFGLPEPGH